MARELLQKKENLINKVSQDSQSLGTINLARTHTHMWVYSRALDISMQCPPSILSHILDLLFNTFTSKCQGAPDLEMQDWQDPDNVASSRNAAFKSEYSDDEDETNKKRSYKIDLKDPSLKLKE